MAEDIQHDPGCDGKHTVRQRCNTNALAAATTSPAVPPAADAASARVDSKPAERQPPEPQQPDPIAAATTSAPRPPVQAPSPPAPPRPRAQGPIVDSTDQRRPAAMIGGLLLLAGLIAIALLLRGRAG
ncbi:MAG: hypothetical protein WEC75_14460 [Dehalococcoidia bacterium]